MLNANSFEVERSSTSASSGFSPLALTVTSTSYTDTTASPGATYWYEVLARNSGGMGSPSSAAIATTPALKSALLANTFEGATNGTAITTQNSGGASGNALNQVKCTSGTITYSTASAAHGQVSALLSPTTGLCYVGWNSTSIAPATAAYGRAYVKFSADPSGDGHENDGARPTATCR